LCPVPYIGATSFYDLEVRTLNISEIIDSHQYENVLKD
jgi:hypothetical protein